MAVKRPKSRSKTSGFTKFRKEWIEPILIAFLIAGVIRSFVIQPFKIPSGSMEDTLLVGDRLMASKFSYGLRLPFAHDFLVQFRDPRPGDVVIFAYPLDPSEDYIKRCIAVGGQTVEIRDKNVYVDGDQITVPAHGKFIDTRNIPAEWGPRDNFGPEVVPAGQLFMMGDNRDNSNDSRFWGFVPIKNVKAKALFIWWSWNTDAPLHDVVHKVRWSRIFDIIR